MMKNSTAKLRKINEKKLQKWHIDRFNSPAGYRPIFFFIISLTLQKTIFDGLIAAVGVMLADYFYILLAIFGIGELLKREKVRRTFGIISSIVLIVFGIYIIKSKRTIPIELIKVSNTIVGCLLVGYGGMRLIKILNKLP